jgi:hypothetical protein
LTWSGIITVACPEVGLEFFTSFKCWSYLIFVASEAAAFHGTRVIIAGVIKLELGLG